MALTILYVPYSLDSGVQLANHGLPLKALDAGPSKEEQRQRCGRM